MVELDEDAHLYASQGRSRWSDGLGIYADGMVEHDRQIGLLLDKLRELGLEENTIVMYSTDNGAEAFTCQMAVPPCSAAKRTLNGKVAIEFPVRFAGLEPSSLGP